MSSPEPTAPKRPPLQPKWIATILVLGIAYLLLRPFLVERFGWNLPGFTDVTPQPESSGRGTEGTSKSDQAAKNRPIEVPTIPEQSEPAADDADVAESDAGKKPRNEKSKSGSESDSSEELPPKPERQVATPSVADKPKVVSAGSKPAKPEPPKPSSGTGTANNSKPTATPKTPATTPPVAKAPAAQPEKPKLGVLKDIGRGTLESTAGLIYRSERSEHRIDHVMQHSRDNATKPVHGVFDGNREEILALIDEAYMIAQKRGPPQVVTEDQGDRETITVNLNRKIGYMGGENGARRNHPPLKKIKLVLEDRDVITAYPTN